MAKVKAYDPTKQEWIPWASNEAAGIITRNPLLLQESNTTGSTDVEEILLRLKQKLQNYETLVNNASMTGNVTVWEEIPAIFNNVLP